MDKQKPQTIHHQANKTPNNSPSGKLKPQPIHYQAVHHQTNRNPTQFTIGQLTTVQTETPDDSPSGNSPPDRNPWAVHHRTEISDNSPLGSSPLDRQKPSGCSLPDRSPRQFTIGMFTTGQTETPDSSPSAEQGCVTV